MGLIHLVVGNGIERIADDVRMDLGIDPTIHHHVNIGADEPFERVDDEYEGHANPWLSNAELDAKYEQDRNIHG